MSQTCTSRGVGVYRTSEAHVLVTDRMYKPNGTRRGIIFAHGVGQTADTNALPPAANLAALAAAGYPVLSCDLSATSYAGVNWANDDHIAAIAAAFTFLTTTGGAKTDKVGLLGASMGAAGALAWARANLSSCFAMAGTIPVLDIDDIYQNDKASLRAGIGTAYGVTYPTSLGSLATHSPTAFGATDLAGLPVNLWCASDDTVAATTAVATAWSGKGATKTVVDLGAVGHNGSSVVPQDVVQFFDTAGGRA